MNQEFRNKSSQPRNFILFISQQLILTLQYIQTLESFDSLLQTCFVVKMSYNNSQSQYGKFDHFFLAFSGIIDNISCSLGYGNYQAGYPSEHSGYGYGGQASTPGSIPGFPTPQPAPVTG